MRRQPRPSFGVLVAAVASLALVAPAVVRADATAAFANFAADITLNAGASFATPGPGSTGALTIDPTNPDTIYILNRAAPASGGAYPFSLSNKARISNTAGAIKLTSDAVMTWTDPADPYSAVVGNDGSLYMLFDVGAGIYKISNPLSDTPTTTKILGNYNNAGDDDPSYVARMPASFGLGNYSANDLLMLDSGIDANNVAAIVAVHADGSDGNAPTVVWKKPAAGGSTARGGVDPASGYFYFINTTPEVNTINGSSYVSLYRVKGDGVLQTIGLQLPAGVTLAQTDDAIAVNPADGSVWIPQLETGTSRTMIRVDTAHMTDTGGGLFLANATTEFTATGFNLGVNSLAFNAAGTALYAGTPDGADTLWIFNVAPDVAPPHFPGDTNNDGVVDLVDLNNVLNNFGATGTNPGDDNADGTVDLVDLNNVLNNFGATHAASALSLVPEPASLALLAVGATTLVARRRRSR